MINQAEEYTPEMIEQLLLHWAELRSAAEGGTGTLAGHSRSKKDRLSLACLVADLERAADQLPREWASTRAIYRLQGRLREWTSSGASEVDRGHSSVWEAVLAMSRTLGWRPGHQDAPSG